MRGMVPPDPEGGVSKTRYAVVYVPRRSRNRFAATCVELKENAEHAQAASDPGSKKFAAKVLGPSKSSEGQVIYYLLKWL
ncbi:MAG: hypothetical protein OXK72_08335 [Gammaproteobacteria bacterium]|nr:hypothetical protein [Gammaproteobacteria bacterium]MDE0412600.1 hypothetical protein [Gammaproteobacteria bacterium]